MNSDSSNTSNVEQHYSRQGLGDAILAALEDAGKDLVGLRPEDLAAIDEFHIRGREATQELASRLNLDASMHILDVGSGLGGASRYLATTFGCRVTGLDLTEEYCRVAWMLADRLGLGGQITYRQGSALAMPFEDAMFDVVWTQHASMNIADKAGLYAEMRRVLKPGGLLAIYDILAGPGGPVHFPVPWARQPRISFLVTPDELRRLLEQTGFHVAHWRDTTAACRDWFRKVTKRMQQQGAPRLGFHLLLGPEFRTMAVNQVRNLEEERIVLIEAVCRRSG
jgi:MPBQ/MSBQ methyltransferase